MQLCICGKPSLRQGDRLASGYCRSCATEYARKWRAKTTARLLRKLNRDLRSDGIELWMDAKGKFHVKQRPHTYRGKEARPAEAEAGARKGNDGLRR